MSGIITVPLHIGDFISGTLHMDAAQKGAYIMLLLAHYQAGECGLPNDDKQLARIAGVTMKKWAEMRPILSKKFEVNDDFWISSKCVEVLQKVHEHSSSQRAKALKRFKSGDAAALPQQSQPKPKPKPYVLLEKEPKAKTEKPPDVSDEVWRDFLKQRKTKFTNTALDGIRREVAKAGISLEDGLRIAVERGWQSFKADWIREKHENTSRNHKKSKTEQLDDIVGEYLAEQGIQTSAREGFDSGNNPAMLSPVQHVRERSIGIENHASGVRGIAGPISHATDYGGFPGVVKN
jgi:uncharacterized protein YdaU (DUF1376 family)